MTMGGCNDTHVPESYTVPPNVAIPNKEYNHKNTRNNHK